jgi:ABC-type nitrate/sulfonate/bicarbonate transport system substrate-binding protein
MRVTWTIIGCVLSILGCLSEAKARTIKLAIPGHSEILPFVIAQEKGFYRDEQLDVEMILMGSTITVRALIAGDVHFSTAANPALTAMLRGAPLRVAFATFVRPLFSLYSKPNIRQVEELKGKRIGIGAIGDSSDHMLRPIIRRHGLEVGKNVELMGSGVTATRYAALAGGALDAAVLSPPTTVRAEEAGFRELIEFMKEDFVSISGGIVLREDLLQSERGLIEKFIRATLKGLLYAHENRTATIPILARMQKIREDQASQLYNFSRQAMTADGSVGETLQKKKLEFDLQVQGLKEGPPLDKIFDFSITRKLNAQLKQDSRSAK